MGTQRRSNMIGDLGQDVRYGLRMLAKNPAFTAIAVLALALGIGANSAIFSVVNAILLRPLPYKNPEQLVMVWENATHLGFPKDTPSPANFLDWRQQTTVFEGMAAFTERSFNLTGVGEPERLDGRRVSSNLFDLLGVRPIIGRTFVPQEDQPGTKVVLLNESLWKRRFGGDPSVIGRVLTLNNEAYTVVGVGFVVQGEHAADHTRIAAETPFPQALVEKDDLRAGLIFLWHKRASDDRPHA